MARIFALKVLFCGFWEFLARQPVQSPRVMRQPVQSPRVIRMIWSIAPTSPSVI